MLSGDLTGGCSDSEAGHSGSDSEAGHCGSDSEAGHSGSDSEARHCCSVTNKNRRTSLHFRLRSEPSRS